MYVWSRGEELVTDRFPELKELEQHLPDGVVIDGEILAFSEDKPLSFNHLQTRIGRKKVTAAVMKKAPVVLMAYDLLEYKGEDLRETPLNERRKLLEQVVVEAKAEKLLLSDIVEFTEWDQLAAERDRSRELFAEGLMLKRQKFYV